MKAAIIILIVGFMLFSAIYLIPALKNIKETTDTRAYQIESMLEGITVEPTNK